AVNPIPTKRVNTVHPQSQIIGDLASLVQTRSRAQKSKFGESAFIGYLQDQQRTNHTDQLFNKDARLKPSNDVGKKVNEVPRQKNKCKDQEEKDSVNITNKVNVVRSTINAANNEANVVGKKSSIELPDDPNMPKLEDISIFEYSNEDVFGAEANLNNLESTFQVSPIPTTRIHKDHPLKQLIRDLHSAPQTRRMSKNLEKRGLVSTVNQRTKTFKIVYLLNFYHKKNPKGNPFFERSKLNRGY
nr:ribonuclease H-like domain, reverse transcriptase, RNA-dependent DNA polymerase [Tanacetum cinerariifolium]